MDCEAVEEDSELATGAPPTAPAGGSGVAVDSRATSEDRSVHKSDTKGAAEGTTVSPPFIAEEEAVAPPPPMVSTIAFRTEVPALLSSPPPPCCPRRPFVGETDGWEQREWKRTLKLAKTIL